MPGNDEWVTKKFRSYRTVALAFALSACATSGPVSTLQVDSHYEIVPEPKGFVSPLLEIEMARDRTAESENVIHRRQRHTGKQWLEYASWAQAWDEREDEQSSLEQELTKTGEVALFPGRSYSFDLESYCIQGGEARPVTGDELKAAPLRGSAEGWLPSILDGQGERRIPQAQVQYLIWALLYDVRFDELSDENKRTLLLFYPDAASRFGSRRLEEVGKSILRGALPSEVTGAVSHITEYREHILALRSDYGKLEQVLAPKSDREKPIPVGWMKMPDGYLVLGGKLSPTATRLAAVLAWSEFSLLAGRQGLPRRESIRRHPSSSHALAAAQSRVKCMRFAPRIAA